MQHEKPKTLEPIESDTVAPVVIPTVTAPYVKSSWELHEEKRWEREHGWVDGKPPVR